MEESKARALSLDLMSNASVVYFSTIDAGGYPQTRALLNLKNRAQFPNLVDLFSDHDGDLLAYFSTNTSSSKISQVRSNPRVAAYYCLPEQWRGLMLGGEVEFIDDIELKKKVYQKGWELYFPQGPTDPDFTLLRLRPAVAKYYQNLDLCDFRP